MKTESVKLVYFSPTGTTKSVVQGIANGINPSTTVITGLLPSQNQVFYSRHIQGCKIQPLFS